MKRKHEEICTTITKNNDVYSRSSTTNQKGRGSLSGWTTCPLCNTSSSTKSRKKFSLGRGISMHLQQGKTYVVLFTRVLKHTFYVTNDFETYNSRSDFFFSKSIHLGNQAKLNWHEGNE